MQGPAYVVPYCYRTRLVIGKVEKNDGNISVVIRNEGETKVVPMDLQVTNLPSSASQWPVSRQFWIITFFSLLHSVAKEMLLS